QMIYDTVQEMVETYQLDYTPYLHLDSVIGWLWFTFLGLSRHEVDWATGQNDLTEKILRVVSKLTGVQHYDSVGIDFHKNGLCPYSSSFFVASNMTIVSDKPLSDYNFGDLRAFDYTLENTRPANGIASAWTSLQRLGLTGYRKYLTDLYKASDQIRNALNNNEMFRVINTISDGWEIIFTINFRQFKDGVTGNYDKSKVYESFIRYVWDKVDSGADVPNFSIIKNYGEWFGFDRGAAFILYNMNTSISTTDASAIVESISNEAEAFQNAILDGRLTLLEDHIMTPIR
ncbi:MAG: hypothetical protein WBA74_17015, partial [Cyclobacteriaceae bacterium]